MITALDICMCTCNFPFFIWSLSNVVFVLSAQIRYFKLQLYYTVIFEIWWIYILLNACAMCRFSYSLYSSPTLTIPLSYLPSLSLHRSLVLSRPTPSSPFSLFRKFCKRKKRIAAIKIDAFDLYGLDWNMVYVNEVLLWTWTHGGTRHWQQQ